MATALQNLIDAYIKRNANQEITGPVLNGVLTAIANALGTPFVGSDGYWYTYDAESGQFVKTDTPAQGETGPVGVTSAAASIDDQIGTPEVDVALNGTQLVFTFKNLKGQKGDTGETGATGPQGETGPVGPIGPQGIQGETGNPGITAAVVTIDSGTGTPSVDASISGTTLTLAFHNLKGETGPAGPTGATGPQGPQGNSGYTGAAGELEVVNNLTDGGATKALSAEMGKTLNGEVSQLGLEVGDLSDRVDDIEDYLMEETIVPIAGEDRNGYVWGTLLSALDQTNWVQKVYAVNAGDRVNIKCQVIQQNANIPAICFVENYVENAPATVIRDSTSGEADVFYTAPSNGYVIVLYSVNGVVKAVNLRVYKYDKGFPENRKVISIRQNGSGDFMTFRAAFDYINANPRSGGYEVRVYNGEYDVLADYTAEEINAASYSASGNGFCGILVPDGVRLVGMGDRDSTIVKGELSLNDYTESVRVQISTLNLSGNCSVENLTITSRNIRYTIHDDFDASVDCTHTIENCRIINHVGSNGVSRSNAIGIGTKSGEHIIIKDCWVDETIGHHNGGDFANPDIITLINTKVLGGIIINDTSSHVQGLFEMLNSDCTYIQHIVATGTAYIKIVGVGDALYPIIAPSYALYETGEVSRKLGSLVSVGQCCMPNANQNNYALNYVSPSADGRFNGICIGIIDSYRLIQRRGYVGSNQLGTTDTTSWAVGTMLKIGSSAYLEPTTDKSEAVARVDFSFSGEYFVKILE